MTRSRMKSRRQASHLAGGGGEVRRAEHPRVTGPSLTTAEQTRGGRCPLHRKDRGAWWTDPRGSGACTPTLAWTKASPSPSPGCPLEPSAVMELFPACPIPSTCHMGLWRTSHSMGPARPDVYIHRSKKAPKAPTALLEFSPWPPLSLPAVWDPPLYTFRFILTNFYVRH